MVGPKDTPGGLAQDRLRRPAATEGQLLRQVQRPGGQLVVEERRSRLQAVGHPHAVYLGQVFVRQVFGDVGTLEVTKPGVPGQPKAPREGG